MNINLDSSRSLFTAICFSVLITSSQAAEKTTSLKLLDQLPKHGEMTASVKALDLAVSKTKQAPQEAKHWIMIGDALAQLQRETGKEIYYDQAEKVYLAALELKPETVDALSGMAWVTGGRHDFAKSIEWANRALKIDSNNTAALGILGDAQLELGDYDDALDSYQKMMDVRPDLSSWSRGAHLLWVMGDKSKAQWLMQKSIHAGAPFAENTAWCRAKMATMLFHEGALLPAQQVIQPLLDQKTKNKHVLLIAAKIAAAKQDYASAISHYETMQADSPSVEALAGIGDVLSAQGKTTEAKVYYDKVAAMHDHHHDHHGSHASHNHHFVAKFFLDHDRNIDDAMHVLEDHQNTKNVQEADLLAWAHFKKGDIKKAAEIMKKALRLKTPDPEMHYHAGMIAYQFGDLTSAKKHLNQAIQMNPYFSLSQVPVLRRTLQKIDSATLTANERK